ncbi:MULTISPECIES: phage tail assembly chaperone [Pseudomonas]|uniref:phage tail assembly chaperone n=1 Tax=Pseudomonas TaxID=286 RepID=UPI001BE8A90E|nr:MULTISPECIES: phage tail assembly chaperone [Pseudomonas]MBT2340630.1 phage tail protein [Pseudomonas fluorescens]MCD4531907.1 phage tail assembly chaperone [Pseudomonas sp. C3-2018]
MNYYCAVDGGFYNSAFHEFIPEGIVEVADEHYVALIKGQEQGRRIISDDNGYPILGDPLTPSLEALRIIERRWRDDLLLASDGLVSRHRDELEEGIVTTLTSERYVDLQAYRRALRNWPEMDEFPLIEYRPKVPDWLIEQPQ